MFKVAFGDKFTEENVIKEFNKENKRENFEMQVCFSSVKRLMFQGYMNLYLDMTLLDGVEEFIDKFNKEFNNIDISILVKGGDRNCEDDYLIKIDISKDYDAESARGIVIYLVCCLIRLFYEDNFGKLGCKNKEVIDSLEEDIFKFIIERNKECLREDRLHSLYGNGDLTKEIILTIDNIEVMNNVAKQIKSKKYDLGFTYAQDNMIWNIVKYNDVKLEKEI